MFAIRRDGQRVRADEPADDDRKRRGHFPVHDKICVALDESSAES
jgi:hypothetical protein